MTLLTRFFIAILCLTFSVLYSQDLAISYVSSSGNVTRGENVHVSFSELNTGTVDIGSHEVGFYLSVDQVLSSGDVFLGVKSIASIGKGQYVSAYIDGLNIPFNTLPGNYYIIAFADDKNKIVEPDELNNTHASPIKVQELTENLQIEQLDIPSSNLSPNINIYVKVWVNATRGTFSPILATYLSSDSLLSSDDKILDNYEILLDSYFGSSRIHERQITMPSLPYGKYYLISKIDNNNAVPELYENDNTKSVAIFLKTPSIDLKTDLFLEANQTVQNAFVHFNTKIQNIGGTPANSVLHGLFLSKDKVYSSDDINLYKENYGRTLYSADSLNISYSFNIPATTSLGSYYVLSVIDYPNKIVDIDRSNNTKAVSINIVASTIDLEIKSLSLSSQAIQPNKFVRVQITESNNGTAESPFHQVSYYISKDAILSADDSLLDYTNVYTISSKAAFTYDYGIAIPYLYTPGSYYIIAKADYRNSIKETNESNNTKSLSITLLPVKRDIAITSSLFPYSIYPGNSYNIQTIVGNLGESSEITNISYALSKDSILSSDDIVLHPIPNYGEFIVDSSKQKSVNTSVFIPNNIMKGSYYFIQMVDAQHLINESDEKNNTKSILVYVDNYEMNLSSTIASDTLLITPKDFSISVNIKNLTGAPLSTQQALYVYLSKDQTIDASDVLLKKNNMALGTYSFSTSFDTSIEGIYYLIAVADAENQITEKNEEDNLSIIKIRAVPRKLDLKLQSVTELPLSVITGQSIAVKVHELNLGNVPINVHHNVSFYLSKDSIFDSNDILLSKGISYGIEAGSYTSIFPELTIPNTTVAGNYYIIAIADQNNVIAEDNEANNEVRLAVKVLPQGIDLKLQSPLVNMGSFIQGLNTVVNLEVSNLGTTTSQSTNVEAYLSTDGILSANDIYLSQQYLQSMQANEKLKINFWLMMPDSITGTRYIIFKVDPDQKVLETNEDNNSYILKINVLKATKDLEIVSLGSTVSRLASGDSTVITAFQRNLGTIEIPSLQHLAFYLSKDSVYDANDTFLAKREIGKMLPSAYAHASLWITIPKVNTFGNYYIVAKADEGNVVLESNESNNTKAFAITVIAPNRDLMLEGFGVPTFPLTLGYSTEVTTAQGSYITPNIRVTCKGTEGALAHRMAFYLSTDSVLQASDTYLTSTAMVAMAPGKSVTVNPQVYISTQIAVGNYYILAVEDYDNTIQEVNENNNVKYIKAYVKAPFVDFAFTHDIYNYQLKSKSLLSNTKLITSNTLNFNFSEYNVGNMASGYHYIAYYLSTDSLYQDDDTYLGNTYADPISMEYLPYAMINTSLSLPTLPNDVEHYIIVVLDYDNKVVESDENNNTAYLKFKKITPQVDLYIDYLKLNNTAPLIEATNSSISFSIKESNNGITEASAHKIGLYLSSDSVFQESDLLMTSQTTSMVWPSSYTQATLSFGLSSAIKAGDYYVFAVGDYEKLISETDENNASKPLKISIIPQTRDLVATQLVVRQQQVEIGKYINIRYTLKNQGNVTVEESNVGVYLSTDSVFSANDKLIATKATASMASGMSMVDSTFYTIPTTTAFGHYYVILVGDYLNKVSEAVETNNSKYVPLEIIYYAVDLTIPTFSLIADARQYVEMSLKLGVKNLGKMPSDGGYIHYFISKDTVWDFNDTRLAYFAISNISPESSLEMTHKVSVRVASGTYYLIASVDQENYIKEYNETNNKRIIPITVLPDDKDFEMLNANIGILSTLPNKTQNAYVTVKNNSVTTRMVRTYCYLSADSLYDAQDQLTGYYDNEIIGKNELGFNMSLAIPSNAASGEQYLIFMVDGPNTYLEIDENNNQKVVRISILDAFVDLKVSNLSIPKAVISKGSVLTGNFKVENIGTHDPSTSGTYICLSSDSIFSSEDIILYNFTINSPLHGTTQTYDFTTKLSQTVDLGNYYLLVVLDPLNKTNDDNTINQTKAVKIDIVPEFTDLVSKESYSFTTVYGQAPSITVKVVNEWMLPVASHSIKTFLSADSIYDPSDMFWSTQTINPTRADGTYFAKLSAQQANVGSYYVLVLLDDKNEIQEINEDNNIAVVKLQVLPQYNDLSVTIAPTNSYSKAVPGKTMYFSTSIINKGSVAYTGNTNVNIFLSKDQNFSKDDINISGVPIPSNTALGQYYAIAVVDLAMSIPEIDETNNVAILPLQVYPPCVDIYMTDFSVNQLYWAVGSKVSYKHKQLNKGSLDAPTFTFDYYLSADSSLSSEDLRVLSTQMNSLPLSITSSSFEGSIMIPQSIDYGTYYFIVKASKPANMDECDEGNNTKFIKVQITGPYADLVPTQVNIPNAIVSAGSSFNISIAMSNMGNLNVGAQQAAIYISKDSILGSTAQLLSVRSYAGFKRDSIVNAAISIPYYIQNGTYYLLVDLDYGKAIAETNENNNLGKVKLTVSPVTEASDFEYSSDISLYPNPSYGVFQVRHPNTVLPTKLEMYDMHQRPVFETELVDDEINIGALPTGVYIIKVKDVSGYIHTEKLVVIK